MYIATKVSKANPAVKATIKATYPTYKGRTVKVNAQGRVTFHDTNWGGGSRNTYQAIKYTITNGKIVIEDTDGLRVPAPWVNAVEGKTVQIPHGFAVVEHSMFCGKDCGITIYVSTEGDSPVAGLLS